MKYSAFRSRIRKLPVFSSAMLGSLVRDTATLRVQLAQWKKKGLVSVLRKGLYVLNPEDREAEPSRFYLANQIFMPSYVSLESALAYYGLIPEFVGMTTSVTVRKTSTFKNEFGTFSYRHLQPTAYSGFVSVDESAKTSFLIAAPEKAVADFLYLNLARFHPADRAIFEKSYRFQNGRSLSARRLRNEAGKFGGKKLRTIMDLFIQEVLR